MIRSSVVLPEPEGPSSATSSPVFTCRLTSESAVNAPKRLVMLRTSMLIRSPLLARLREIAARLPLHKILQDQRDQGEQRQERCHSEGPDEVILVVEDLDVQGHRVREPANVPGDDRDGAKLPHGPRVAQDDPVQQA